jgi:hypothetical protein
VQRYFSIYWIYESAQTEHLGKPLIHAAGTFKRRGVEPGAVVYVFTGTDGRLILMGKMEVGNILDSDAETERLLGFEPWSAPEHLIASACTPLQRETLPVAVGKALRFVSRGGKVELSFDEGDWLDLQSMRGVRQLGRKAPSDWMPYFRPSPGSYRVSRGPPTCTPNQALEHRTGPCSVSVLHRSLDSRRRRTGPIGETPTGKSRHEQSPGGRAGRGVVEQP